MLKLQLILFVELTFILHHTKTRKPPHTFLLREPTKETHRDFRCDSPYELVTHKKTETSFIIPSV